MINGITLDRVAIVGSVLVSAAILAGCTSKPGDSDIGKQVGQVFQCSPFDVVEVKKTDGAVLPDNQYQVALTFEAHIKGGKSGAATLLANIMKGRVDLETARDERNHKPFEQREEGNKKVKQLEKQLQDLQGGECESIQTSYLLDSLLEGTNAKLKNMTGPIAVPYIVKMQGVVNMSKAESGWVFTQIPPFFTINEVVESEPIQFSRPVAVAVQ